jgi:DNA repair protein RecO (recombination protein O)
LLEGVFSDNIHEKNVISKNDFYQFKKLLGIIFDTLENVTYSKEERQLVLQVIIQYFKLHLDSFRNPKSLQVLETVFS